LFLAHHIDSIIQLVLGAFVTWFAFRRSSKLGARTRTLLRVCGPGLIVIGGVLLFKPDPAASWETRLTMDKIASAEFPGAPASKETTDTVGALTVKRTSFTYDVPGKDIALALSYSALPENTRAMTDAQRIDSTLAYLTSQGAKILQNEKSATGSIYRLKVRQDDTALTDRFVNSFRIEP
jgi:hypothetical protein